MDKQRIIDFWFEELGPEAWYQQSDEVDALITVKFSKCLLATTEIAKSPNELICCAYKAKC